MTSLTRWVARSKNMCMVAAVVTKEVAILATDSALTTNDKIQYNNPKLFFWGNRYLCTGMGVPAYIAKLDFNKFKLDVPGLCMYLEDYFKSTREHVKETLANLEEKEIDPSLCFMLAGVHKERPVVVEFSSYLDFKPKYFLSREKPKFVPILYDKENKTKAQMFDQTLEYMETRAHKFEKKGTELTVGILGEILTRGIYKKSDLEFELTGKKSTGGVVSVGAISATGQAQGLSHIIV